MPLRVQKTVFYKIKWDLLYFDLISEFNHLANVREIANVKFKLSYDKAEENI